jgi:NTP pyrophosphatase (non-canonical NTP hydrolase)
MTSQRVREAWFRYIQMSQQEKAQFHKLINTKERDILKCVEELNELASVLIKQHNKPRKDYYDHIIEEIGDVIYRVDNLYNYYDKDEVQKRIDYKKDKGKS